MTIFNTTGRKDQVALLLSPLQRFIEKYSPKGIDLRIYGHEGDVATYKIFLRNDPNEARRHLDYNRRGFPRGVDEHDIHHHGVRLARQILIKNIGNTELHIDAVSVVYKDTISATEDGYRPH